VPTACHSGVIGNIHDFKQPRQFVRVIPKGHNFAIPRRDSPEFLQQSFRPKKIEGAGNAGCPTHPQPRVRNKTNTRVSHHRSTETARHSLRNGLNGLCRALVSGTGWLESLKMICPTGKAEYLSGQEFFDLPRRANQCFRKRGEQAKHQAEPASAPRAAHTAWAQTRASRARQNEHRRIKTKRESLGQGYK
jgi:hypothetical protein